MRTVLLLGVCISAMIVLHLIKQVRMLQGYLLWRCHFQVVFKKQLRLFALRLLEHLESFIL